MKEWTKYSVYLPKIYNRRVISGHSGIWLISVNFAFRIRNQWDTAQHINADYRQGFIGFIYQNYDVLFEKLFIVEELSEQVGELFDESFGNYSLFKFRTIRLAALYGFTHAPILIPWEYKNKK